MSSDLTKECYAVALLDLRKRAPSAAASSHLQPQIKVFTKLKMATQISERGVVHSVLSSPCSSGPEIGPKTDSLVSASPSLISEVTVKNEPQSSSETESESPDPPSKVSMKAPKVSIMQPIILKSRKASISQAMSGRTRKIIKLESNCKTTTSSTSASSQVVIKEEGEEETGKVMFRSKSDDHDNEGDDDDQRLRNDSDQNGNRNDSNDNGNENEHENNDWHDDDGNEDDGNDDDGIEDDEAYNTESLDTDSSKAIFRVISVRCPIPNCPQTDIQDFEFVRATYTIDKHARRVHGLCSMPSICLVCNRQYSERQSHATEDLDKHLQKHHSNGAQLQCYKCSKSFKSYSSVNRHHHLVHFEACFGCVMANCNFTSTTRIEIYRHNRDEHPKFYCSFEGCNSKFKYRSEFRRHNWSHVGVTQFQCAWPDCDWQGSNIRAIVWTHVKEFHLGHEHDHEQYVRQLTFTEALREKGKLDFEIQ